MVRVRRRVRLRVSVNVRLSVTAPAGKVYVTSAPGMLMRAQRRGVQPLTRLPVHFPFL